MLPILSFYSFLQPVNTILVRKTHREYDYDDNDGSVDHHAQENPGPMRPPPLSSSPISINALLAHRTPCKIGRACVLVEYAEDWLAGGCCGQV